jgi:hypothetical protein
LHPGALTLLKPDNKGHVGIWDAPALRLVRRGEAIGATGLGVVGRRERQRGGNKRASTRQALDLEPGASRKRSGPCRRARASAPGR